MSTPTTVEVGQMWKDLDRRSRGTGEFTVWAVVHADGTVDRLDEPPAAWPRAEKIVERIIVDSGGWPRQQIAVVYRHETDRLTTIRISRLLHGPYELIGKSR